MEMKVCLAFVQSACCCYLHACISFWFCLQWPIVQYWHFAYHCTNVYQCPMHGNQRLGGPVQLPFSPLLTPQRLPLPKL